MPYIITVRDPIATNQSKHVDPDGTLRYDADNSEVFPGPTGVRPSRKTTRAAVATLEEAREVVQEQIVDANYSYGIEPERFQTAHDEAGALPDSGGTIGPLPDGSVIEVRLLTEDQLRAAVAYRTDDAYKRPLGEIIDAYNARSGD